MITIHDVLKFILRHRKNKVFKNLTEIDIFKLIQWAAENNNMLVDTDENHQHIYGVAISKLSRWSARLIFLRCIDT